MIDTLAAAIKAKQSPFYTGPALNTVAEQLAQRVNSGFSLRSVADPNTDSGDSGSGSSGSSGTGATSSGSKARQDAIIGVVSALGAIALLVLLFLIYRSIKRRQQLAHRRLSDPPDMGVRPDGREFDRDSVGGARRRSFYFAEDSLRGFQGDRQDDAFDQRMMMQQPQQGPGASVTQRRNVMPGAISAPILRESSMNW
jgi:hypothetical protein